MTQATPPQEPGFVAVAPRPSNPMGIVAFVISLVGLLAGGLGVCCPPLGLAGLMGSTCHATKRAGPSGPKVWGAHYPFLL